MWLYAARRVLMTIPICLGVSVLCFVLIYLAPGNPVQNLLPPGATAQDVMTLKHAYGLDKPIPVQYVIWLGHALTGNLGISIQTNRPVVCRGDAGAPQHDTDRGDLVRPRLRDRAHPRHSGGDADRQLRSIGWRRQSPCSASACRASGSASCWSSISRSSITGSRRRAWAATARPISAGSSGRRRNSPSCRSSR